MDFAQQIGFLPILLTAIAIIISWSYADIVTKKTKKYLRENYKIRDIKQFDKQLATKGEIIYYNFLLGKFQFDERLKDFTMQYRLAVILGIILSLSLAYVFLSKFW